MSAEPVGFQASDPPVLRFGPFTLDRRSSELWKGGVPVKIQLQPFRVLAMLVGRPGEVLTREEIQREIWPEGTFVDFEQSLNFCIRHIRTSLGDQADTPRYIETLPRRGYRFVAPVISDVLAPIGEASDSLPDGRPRRAWLMAVAAIGLLALAGLAWRVLAPVPAAATTPTFERLTFRRGSVFSARFAGGGQVAYSASWEGRPNTLFSVGLESRESRRIEVDGRMLVGVQRQGEVAFLRDGVLARAPLAGGPPKEILTKVRTADWATDGEAFAVARYHEGEMRVEYPIGSVLGSADSPTHLRISPDGNRVAFLEHPTPGDDRGSVVVLERTGGRRELSGPWASAEGLAWSPDGSEVWFTATRAGADAALHAVDLEGRERTLVPSMGRLVLHDVDPDGRVLLERNTLRQEIKFGGPDGQERDLSWLDLSGLIQLTADAKTILFMESGEGGGAEYTIFLRDTEGSIPVRVGPGRAMGLSSDGRWVLSIPVAQPDRIDVLPTGPGEVRVIRQPGIAEYVGASWIPDTDRFIFTGRHADGGLGIYERAVGGDSARLVTSAPQHVYEHAVSPDGRRFVAYAKDEMVVYSLAEGIEPRGIPVEGTMRFFGWADAARVYVRGRDGGVWTLNVDTGELQPWRQLSPYDPAGLAGIGQVSITPDGRHYAYAVHRRLSDLYLVEGLR